VPTDAIIRPPAKVRAAGMPDERDADHLGKTLTSEQVADLVTFRTAPK
jgi:hypothetical protein